MRVTDALRGEHGPLLALLAHCERSAGSWELADLLLAGRTLEAALLSHARLEDELLIRPLVERSLAVEPARATAVEHEQILAVLAGLRERDDEVTARRDLMRLVGLARDHFHREEAVLFPLAERCLAADWQERLAGEWAARRGIELAESPAG